MKKKLKIFLGLAVSIVFIILIGMKVDPKETWNTFKTINYFIILPAILVQTSSYYLRSMRWSIMLDGIKPIKASRLFSTICISYAANNTLPLRAGDFARAYLIGHKEGISKTASFSTIILEKIYDGITLLLFLGTIALVFPFPIEVKSMGIGSALIFLGALVFTISLVAFREKTQRVTVFFLKPLPQKYQHKIIGFLDKLIEGFDTIKNKKNLIKIAFLSIFIWLIEASMIFTLAHAFGFDDPITIAMISIVIINLGIMIPSSPGYVGVFEKACEFALSLFKISSHVALAFALVYRFAIFVPVTLIGIGFALKEGISFGSLMSGQNDETS